MESLYSLRVGVIFKDLVHPLRVERHIDEDARLVGTSAASAVDAHTNDNPDIAVLAH